MAHPPPWHAAHVRHCGVGGGLLLGRQYIGCRGQRARNVQLGHDSRLGRAWRRRGNRPGDRRIFHMRDSRHDDEVLGREFRWEPRQRAVGRERRPLPARNDRRVHGAHRHARSPAWAHLRVGGGNCALLGCQCVRATRRPEPWRERADAGRLSSRAARRDRCLERAHLRHRGRRERPDPLRGAQSARPAWTRAPGPSGPNFSQQGLVGDRGWVAYLREDELHLLLGTRRRGPTRWRELRELSAPAAGLLLAPIPRSVGRSPPHLRHPERINGLLGRQHQRAAGRRRLRE